MNKVLAHAYEKVVGDGLMPFYETRLRGRNTFRYRDEFEANQWCPPEQIRALQWERLQALLKHAYKTVDYYQCAFDALGIRPEDIRTPADFARLPILAKALIRKNSDRLISSAFDKSSLIRSATGGSTGEPLQFYYDHNSYERRVAAAMRGDSWAGWRLCGEEFYIWGAPLMAECGAIRWKKRLHHAALRRQVVNSFEQLTPGAIAAIVRRYNQQSPRVVIGYANAVYEFARYVQQAGLRLRAPQGVVTSAEKLYRHQRELIETVFGARVFDRYGCREVMMIAAECECHNGLHVTADNLYVEVVRSDGSMCAPGETGEILLTDLHNYGMPLVRYKVGDSGSWKGQDCTCGRGLPLLNVVEGRVLDIIRTPSGRVVPGEFFPHLLKDFAQIGAYQIIQESMDTISVRISLTDPLSEQQETLLKGTIHRMLDSEMRVIWEIGEDVIIERGRKFRPVLSRVPANFGTASSSASPAEPRKR